MEWGNLFKSYELFSKSRRNVWAVVRIHHSPYIVDFRWLSVGRGVTIRSLVGCKYRHALRAKHFGSRAFWRGRPRAVLSFVFYAIWEAYMMLKAPTHVPAKFHIDTWNAPWAPQVRRRGLRDPKLLQPTESQRYRCPTASQRYRGNGVLSYVN